MVGEIIDAGLTRGIGCCEKGKYKVKVGRRNTKEYDLWNKMLQRCYDSKLHQIRPSYIGCEVSDNFKSYQYFAEWCNNQIGFNGSGWQLDKDIILKYNKIYSEDTCCFVPKELNTVLLQCNSSRGLLPIGVDFHKKTGKYMSRVSVGGKTKYLGLFVTAEEAFMTYKTEKEINIKQIANKYVDSIDNRAYNSLINWTVEFHD